MVQGLVTTAFTSVGSDLPSRVVDVTLRVLHPLHWHEHLAISILHFSDSNLVHLMKVFLDKHIS